MGLGYQQAVSDTPSLILIIILPERSRVLSNILVQSPTLTIPPQQ